MTAAEVNLAALVGSRICHDLVNSIGAVSNGAELAAMTRGACGPEIELIRDSAEDATARIRFFRIAYGAAGDQDLSRSEITAALAPLTGSGRLTVAWNLPDPCPRRDVRRAFLALQCLDAALPMGGRIEVAPEASGRLVLEAEGDRLRIEPEQWSALSDGQIPSQTTPATVQFALLAVLLAENGQRAEVALGQRQISLTV